jgi:hypothetical protein
VYALHSRMSELDYAVEPEVECLNNDPNDAAFVRVTTTIGGHDVVEEHLAWKLYLLAASFDSESVPLGMTPVSKVVTPLPLFAVGTIAAEHADCFLVEVETEGEWVLGIFGPREYDALRVANIPIGDCLNRILEHLVVSYFPRPQPGSVVSHAANKKRKAEVAKKPAAKKVKAGSGRAPSSKMVLPMPKAGPAKKVAVMKIAQPKSKPGPRGTSEIELALARAVGVSKMFCLLDVAASSHEPQATGAPRLALLRCRPSTISTMTQRRMFARPLHQER